MERLYKMLEAYAQSDYYPFHMPGHKRSSLLTGAALPYSLDITEIDGFDDLHHAEGVLMEAEERAAELYRAEETHYLINGSTAGILSAVLGCTERGGKILMARNCHKSVYNAVFMNELHPVYVYPEYFSKTELCGEIRVSDVERILASDSEIKAVVITSPTYDGVVSDVRGIAGAAHRKGIPLIVDEAHGAHFGFHPYFPENSNTKDADVVIHSLHKTLPSLTQTALIHINGNLVDRGKIRRYLHILQSSSPSYVLMAGMDECIRMLSERGREIFDRYACLLEKTRVELQNLRNIEMLSTENYDRSKMVISVKNASSAESGMTMGNRECGNRKPFTGRMLYQILLGTYHLQMEMAAGSYVLAMTSPADTESGMARLVTALSEIDARLEKDPEKDSAGEKEKPQGERQRFPGQEIIFIPSEVERQGESIAVSWEQAQGRVAVEYAYLYPPGIPLVVPGERIGRLTSEKVREYIRMGFTIEGTEMKGKIRVLADG